jgi:hypothetical protein
MIDSLPILNEESQRRLVLRAAKECAPEVFKRLRLSQPTFTELDKQMRETVLAGLLFVWTLFIPFAACLELVPLWRIRRAIGRNWSVWLVEADPEVAQLIVEGAIRRVLRDLPRSRRREARGVWRELDRISRHWNDFHRKLTLLRGVLYAAPEEELEASRREMALRIAEEPDAMTRASLGRQLQAIEGQQQARHELLAWQARLEAAQGECTQSLLHLRSRLTLLAASGGATELAAVGEATADLQAVNANLSAAQAAAEEVLRLRL